MAPGTLRNLRMGIHGLHWLLPFLQLIYDSIRNGVRIETSVNATT
jgi:hypothetical protein